MIYCDVEFFIENYGDAIKEDEIENYLKKASREIDKYLIYRPANLLELSDYEADVFKHCTCTLAIFLKVNSKYLSSVVNSLGIAGTSYSFDNNTILQKEGAILSALDCTRYMNRVR